MLVILLYHHWTFLGSPRWMVGGLDLLAPVGFGYLGVNLFLVLSGFCLAYPFWRSPGGPVWGMGLGEFYRRRFVRIAPAYLATLAVVTVLAFPQTYRSGAWRELGWDVAVHLVFLHNLWPETIATLNPVFWSLALEWQLYLIFPLLLTVSAKAGLGPMLAGSLLVNLVYRAAIFPACEHLPWKDCWALCYWPPGRIFEFAMGIAAARWVAAGALRPRWLRSVPMLWAVAAGGAGLTWWQVSYHGRYSPAGDVFSAFVSVALLLLGSTASIGPGAFRPRWLVAAGTFSYSIYLVHWTVGDVLGHHVYPRLAAGSFLKALVGLAYLTFVVFLGWIWYRLFERPFMGRRA